MAPLALYETNPPTYGMFDSGTKVWTVTGPTVTGGPDGSGPGNYPLVGWGSISLAEATGGSGGSGGSGGTGGTHVPALGALGIVTLCSLVALVGIRRFRD